jgi:hypothetical protein
MINQTSRSSHTLICDTSLRYTMGMCLALLAWCPSGRAQANNQAPASAEEVKQLREVVQSLLTRVTELENELKQRQPASTERTERNPTVSIAPPPATLPTVTTTPATAAAESASLEAAREQAIAEDHRILDYLHGATLNFALDEYYGYNFNRPVGRVNALRAYDVLSNNISLNQAALVFEGAPDAGAGRPFGVRLDLQFGQATDTLQGNPANEPRPQIYRNVFQAYGTYVAPLGSGLILDVGKWGSSIGIEGNYTKDQMNYSRAFWFDFLPFYHMGVRAGYKLNHRLTLNYWLVNGTNQVEATNGFKDELFGFTAALRKSITWNVNYYLGQEHPDRVPVSTSGPLPVQPGLTFTAIRPAPDGRLHIFDSYVSWQVAPKLTLALEGDYVIQREWRTSSPGRSSTPSHVIGGAALCAIPIHAKDCRGGPGRVSLRSRWTLQRTHAGPEGNYRHSRLQICRGIPDAVRVAPGLLEPAVISNRSGRRAEQRTADRHGRGYLVVWKERRRLVNGITGKHDRGHGV